jgi:hypothetical protein
MCCVSGDSWINWFNFTYVAPIWFFLKGVAKFLLLSLSFCGKLPMNAGNKNKPANYG